MCLVEVVSLNDLIKLLKSNIEESKVANTLVFSSDYVSLYYFSNLVK